MKLQMTFCAYATQARRLALALSLTVAGLFAFNGQAHAQTCSDNMDFGDPGSPRYLSGGSGSMAFRGFLTGNVFGRVRNGQLRDFDLRLDPDVNGPNGLRLMLVNYNASSSVIPPTFKCAPTANGAKITITRVPTARQYFHRESTSSRGYADVEITFESVGPGRIVVHYRHSSFSRADTTPPRPYNGRIVNAVPQAGARLTITNR